MTFCHKNKRIVPSQIALLVSQSHAQTHIYISVELVLIKILENQRLHILIYIYIYTVRFSIISSRSDTSNAPKHHSRAFCNIRIMNKLISFVPRPELVHLLGPPSRFSYSISITSAPIGRTSLARLWEEPLCCNVNLFTTYFPDKQPDSALYQTTERQSGEAITEQNGQRGDFFMRSNGSPSTFHTIMLYVR